MFKVTTANIEKNQIVYLSGPMTGLPDYNREAFNMRAESFRAQGYIVNNPADISVRHGTDKSYEFYLRRSLRMLLDSDVMYIFGDITESKGVETELEVAKKVGIRTIWEVRK